MKRALIFTGQGEKMQTENPQLDTFRVCMKLAKQLMRDGIKPDATAGLSLGEYASLAIAKVFTEDDLGKILEFRQKIMDEALQNTDTGMVACIGASADEIQAEVTKCHLEITNYNSPIQVVVGGKNSDLRLFKNELSTRNDISLIDMPTNGAFHSSYLQDASDEMLRYLAEFEVKTPIIPIYHNLTGQKDAEDIRETMAKHISHPVLFQKDIENMIKDSVDEFYVIGIGTAPVNLIRQISKAVGAKVKVVKVAES